MTTLKAIITQFTIPSLFNPASKLAWLLPLRLQELVDALARSGSACLASGLSRRYVVSRVRKPRIGVPQLGIPNQGSPIGDEL